MPGAASFLLAAGSRSQAALPHPLAHFLTASRSAGLSLSPPPPHARTPVPTHSLTPGRRSLPHSPVARPRARAIPLTPHTQRTTPARPPRVPRPRRRAPPARAEDPRGPAPKRRTRGRGAAGGGAGRRGERARPTDTCEGTSPLPEGSHGARAREGRHAGAPRTRLATRPQTVLSEPGKRVGGEVCSARHRESRPCRCAPSRQRSPSLGCGRP